MVLCEENKNSLTMKELSRQRILGYAESFKELADCFVQQCEISDTDRKTVFENIKLWENRQVIGSNLDEMAKIMRQLSMDLYAYLPMDAKQMRQLSHGLKMENVYLEGACYMPISGSKKALALTLYTPKRDGVLSENVASLLSVLLKKKIKVSINSPYVIDRTKQIYLFVEEPKYTALTGYARATKENEEISGDNYSVLESERGILSLILSDGTGSGRKACEESGQVLDMMEKMIETGYDPKQAISLVNAAVCAGDNGTSHPTLDFCMLDLYEGTCDIYKIGAAASFLKRQRETEIVMGENLPLGVFQKAEYMQKSFALMDGEYVIMMTDGVLDAFSEGGFELVVENLLEQVDSPNPESIANCILQKAIFESKGHIRDDMTVLVAGIFEVP